MSQRIVVLASGAGTTFLGVVEAFRKQAVTAEFVGLVTDRADIGAIAKAEELGVPHFLVDYKAISSESEFEKKLLKQLKSLKPDFIFLLGFLKKIGGNIVGEYSGKMINSHPSLLPQYGGKGMYGSAIHRVVIANRESETGVTVHYVNSEYDKGAVLGQKRIPVLLTDDAESLESRVKEIEKGFLIETLLQTLKLKR